MMASNSARASTSTSAIMNMRMFSSNARATSGKESRASELLKNDRLTDSHPGALTTDRTIAPSTTTVLTTAMVVFATGSYAPWRIASAADADSLRDSQRRRALLQGTGAPSALSDSQVVWI